MDINGNSIADRYCFFNGQITLLSEAKISLYDIGILRGFGVYEALPAFGGKPFRFADHWNRFVDSAHSLGLNIPITEEKAEKVMKELLEKNNLKERANIRIILTGGPAINGIEFNFETPTFYILVEKFEPLPKEIYEKGGKLVTYRHLRERPEHKTINYLNAVNLQAWRKEEGALEILYTYDGEVLEPATSNIFIIKDGVLITSAENILKGITRKVVLEIAAESGIKVEERIVDENELQTADEIFITSSFKDVAPITQIDDFKVGNGEVGPITKDLMGKFKALISQ